MRENQQGSRDTESDSFDERGTQHLNRDRSWSPPQRFWARDAGDRHLLAALLASGRVTQVIDPIAQIADELFDISDLGDLSDNGARERFGLEFDAESHTFGVWIYFPWSGELIRYPDRQEHRSLRTFRNRDLITRSEQLVIAEAKIAVLGLSVGSNIVDQFVRVGIGSSYLLGDMDSVKASNLNRMRASMRHVGVAKIDVLGRKISELDPYIEQVHLPSGYSDSADEELTNFKPDLIVEEVDDLAVKARIRQWASLNRTPLIMVTDAGERSVVDVERHDLGNVQPFNGRVKSATLQRLIEGQLTDAERKRVTIKIVGSRNLSIRLLESALQVDKRLAGMPQLISAASAGAAVASVAARAILCGEPLKSGSYVLSPRRLLRIRPQAGIRESFRVLGALRASLTSS